MSRSLSRLSQVGVAIFTVLIASSVAQAGSCEDAKAEFKKQVAADNADTSDSPKVSKKTHDYMEANIRKGCAPGGVYEKLDEAMESAKATCKAHPETKGC